MEYNNEYVLIVTIVNKGWSEPVLEAAREAGARGATVLYGRGAGAVNAAKLFGLAIEPEKEVILNAVPTEIAQQVQIAIRKSASLCQVNTGISMMVPLLGLAGAFEQNNCETE